MRYITVVEALDTYQRVMRQSGGLIGIRDLGALESAVAQPYMTFNDQELYPSLADKAAALGFSLIQNHPFARWQQTYRTCGYGGVFSFEWI